MSRSANIQRSRPLPPILVGVVISLLVLLALASLSSYRDLTAARSRQHLLEQKIEETQVRNQALASRIRRLQSDPASIEALAREQYRMMRPGDVVIVLPEESPPQPAPHPVPSPPE